MKEIKVIKLQIAMIRITELTAIMIIMRILFPKIRIFMKSIKTATPKIKIKTIYRISK